MKTTLSFENDDEQLDRCKEEVRNGSHLEGRTKLFQRKCSKSSPSSLGITVAPIMCPDGVVNDSFRSTLLRFIRRRQSTLSVCTFITPMPMHGRTNDGVYALDFLNYKSHVFLEYENSRVKLMVLRIIKM